MSIYTIQTVTGQSTWDSQKGGPMISYKVNIKGDDGFEGPAEVNQKDTTPAPTAGQQIEGTLDKSNPKFPPKLKKAQQGFGGGGGGKSKVDQDSIERSVAYKGAVELACATSPMDDTKAQNPPAQMEQLVERFFNHGLTLLQGGGAGLLGPRTTVTTAGDTGVIQPDGKPAGPPSPNGDGPTLDDLRDAYKNWAGEDEDAYPTFANKLTTLGLENVEAANPEQRKELLAFLA